MKCGNACAAVTLAVVLAAAGAARANSLNLPSCPPDIAAGWVEVSYAYDSLTEKGLLTAYGWASDLDDDGKPPAYPIDYPSPNPSPDPPYTFTLSATIDKSGQGLAGSLGIYGTVAGLGFTSGTLLTGDLMDFGFVPVDGSTTALGFLLEFLFSVTGGDAASMYRGYAGVTLTTGEVVSPAPPLPPLPPNPFARDFYCNGLGAANTRAVPEPLTGLALIGSLLPIWGYVRRRVRANLRGSS